MTDFRALCAELLASYEDTFVISEPSDDPLVQQARAALAQPEPQGPTDEELKAAYWEAFKNAAPCGAEQSWLAGLRAVACWDRPVIEPVPVAERLPGPEDCDAEGCCWAIGERGNWMCVHVLGRSWSNPIYTHWLPHHALPVPQREGSDD
jgi:hypothetical protein